MPPKGKKGKTGKKKSKAKDEIVRPSEKEAILQAELDKKVQELADLKLRFYKAQEENHWLNEEAQKVKIQMGEYTSFMSKKTNLRQTQIITLTDYHRKQIEDIQQDKQNMLKDSQQKKQDLRAQLIRKKDLLVETKKELDQMTNYQVIQHQQNDEIRRLQNEITRVRNEHVRSMAQMRHKFEGEVQRQRTEEEAKVEGIRRQANQAAEQFLYDQTLSIQDENVRLRTSLQDIVKKRQELKEFKQNLEEEQLHLIRRSKLVADLRKIRLDRISSDVTNQTPKLTPH